MSFSGLLSPNFKMSILRPDGAQTVRHDTFAADMAKVSAHLHDLGLAGSRVAIVSDAGPGFFAAFMGCLHAGAVPFALKPLRGGGGRVELDAVIDDAEPSLIMTDAANFTSVSQAFGGAHPVVSVDQMPAQNAPAPARFDADTVAYLQYSSGSTTAPKGILISYGNLLSNIDMIRQCFQATSDDVFVSWLPHYHDMGLVGAHLLSARLGLHLVQIPSNRFVVNPMAWLQAISDYRGTISGAPNFAYDLCAQRAEKGGTKGLDLTSWRVAFNGSDTVHADTLRRFDTAFAPVGLSKSTLKPVYGLAESTVFISGAAAGKTWKAARISDAALQSGQFVESRDGEPSVDLVNCGQLWGDQEVIIVNPETREPKPDRQIGEIWVRGPHTAKSYLNNDAQSQHTLNASTMPAQPGLGNWLRSGDLGCVVDGDVFITGRMKDVIVLNGRTLAAPDIETCIGDVSATGLPGTVAFETRMPDGSGAITMVAEVPAGASHHRMANDLWHQANAELERRFECRLGALVLVRSGRIPRTTSGKLRRSECRRRLEAGQITPLWTKTAVARPTVPAPKGGSVDSYLSWIQTLARDVAGAADLRTDIAIAQLGVDSLSLLRLVLAIEEALGPDRLNLTNIEARTLTSLAQDLAGASPDAVDAPAQDVLHPRWAVSAGRVRRVLHRLVPLPAYAPLLKLRLQTPLPLSPAKAELAQNTRLLCADTPAPNDPFTETHRNLHALTIAHRLRPHLRNAAKVDRFIKVHSTDAVDKIADTGRGTVYVGLHTHMAHLLPLASRFRDRPMTVVGNYLVGPDGPTHFHFQRLADARQALLRGGNAFVLIDGNDGDGGIPFTCAGRQRVMRKGFAELAIAGDAVIVPVLQNVLAEGAVSFDLGTPVDPKGDRGAIDDVCRFFGAWLSASWPKQLGYLNNYGQRMHLTAPRVDA